MEWKCSDWNNPVIQAILKSSRPLTLKIPKI